jgi:hypothetical protein
VPRSRRADFALGACRLGEIRLTRCTGARTSRRFLLVFFCSWAQYHSPIREAGRTRRSTIFSTVDQSDIRVLVNACFDSPGLPHPTSERPAHPEPGSRVARGFPLTVQMPQPVRPTPRVNAHARTSMFATLRNDLSLRHQHLPRGCRPDVSNACLYLNFFLPSRLRHHLALTVLGRGDGEGGRGPSCRAGAELLPWFCPHTLRGKRFSPLLVGSVLLLILGGLDEQAVARSL